MGCGLAPMRQLYVPQEDQARAAKCGIWNSRFEMPWGGGGRYAQDFEFLRRESR